MDPLARPGHRRGSCAGSSSPPRCWWQRSHLSAAAAITNGRPDGNRHPNGRPRVTHPVLRWHLDLLGDADRRRPTAAHCGEDGERVAVTFDSAYEAGDKLYYGRSTLIALQPVPERPARHRGRRLRRGRQASPQRDCPRRTLWRTCQRTRGSSPSATAPARSPTSRAATGTSTTTSDATGTLNATNPAWLRISMNPATGNGGTCYGDARGDGHHRRHHDHPTRSAAPPTSCIGSTPSRRVPSSGST